MIYFWGCLVVWKETFLVMESSRLCPESESVPAAKKMEHTTAWCNMVQHNMVQQVQYAQHIIPQHGSWTEDS